MSLLLSVLNQALGFALQLRPRTFFTNVLSIRVRIRVTAPSVGIHYHTFFAFLLPYQLTTVLLVTAGVDPYPVTLRNPYPVPKPMRSDQSKVRFEGNKIIHRVQETDGYVNQKLSNKQSNQRVRCSHHPSPCRLASLMI